MLFIFERLLEIKKKQEQLMWSKLNFANQEKVVTLWPITFV